MLLDVIYSLFVAVTAGQGRKRPSSFPAVPGCCVCRGELSDLFMFVNGSRQELADGHFVI